MSNKIPGLYVHLPFCLSKCHYCSFYSITTLTDLPDLLLAVSREITLYKDLFSRFNTIYFGGGTPSLLTARQFEYLITFIRNSFEIDANAEVTMEANPADMSKNYLTALRNLGINRINIGIQSFDESILNFLGRRHTPAEGISAIEAAQNAGFSNIGIDLIYAIPGQDMNSWRYTLGQAISLNLQHLSCYQLSIADDTPLGKKLHAGDFTIPTEDSQADYFLETSSILEDSGYIHYEVSNFAKNTDFASRHNQKYWDHTPYLGAGPTAHSFCKGRRWWNHGSVEKYISDASNGKRPLAAEEYLTEEQLSLESIMLGLRTRKGIDLADFSKKHPGFDWNKKSALLGLMEESNFLEITEAWIKPTSQGLALADSLAYQISST